MARKFRMFMAVADANELSKCCGVPFTPRNGDGVCLLEVEWCGQGEEHRGKVLTIEQLFATQGPPKEGLRRRMAMEVERVTEISASIAHGKKVK